MKVSTSFYRLLPAPTSKRIARIGALLRFTFPDGNIGYSDCHPWIELGDLPLAEQLALLAHGEFTPLTERSLHFASIDAKARGEGKSLFDRLSAPKSHWHAASVQSLSCVDLDLLAKRGFEAIKFKWGKDFRESVSQFDQLYETTPLSSFRLRFDFNCNLSKEDFVQFLSLGKKWIDHVEYFEDPFPYEPQLWREMRSKYGIKLACDLSSGEALDFPESCDYLVIKPALLPIEPFLSEKRGERKLVVTSYLDHPVGLLSAAYTAAKCFDSYREAFTECGLLTHYSYQSTPFCEGLREISPSLAFPTTGKGWGYDGLLAGMNWEPLS